MSFQGATYEPERDRERLGAQLGDVLAFLLRYQGEWFTPPQFERYLRAQLGKRIGAAARPTKRKIRPLEHRAEARHRRPVRLPAQRPTAKARVRGGRRPEESILSRRPGILATLNEAAKALGLALALAAWAWIVLALLFAWSG